MKSISKTLSYEDRERAFWFLVSVCFLSFVAYVYAINATAHHTAIRQNLEREVAELNTEIGSLEFALIDVRSAVTLERAVGLGFSEVKRPLYVSRAPRTSLTLNTDRR